MLDNNNSALLLGVAFLLLGLIYSLIGGFAIKILVTMIRQHIYLGSVFYLSIILICLGYLITMSIYLYDVLAQSDETSHQTLLEQTLVNTIYIPDAIFWITYQSLFWNVVCVHYDARMHSGMQNQLPFNPNTFKHKLEYIFLTYLVVQSILIDSIIFKVDTGINLSIPLQMLITTIYLHFKYSGSPFRSKSYENQTNRLSSLTLFWTFMRLVQTTFNLIVLYYYQEILQFFQSQLSDIQTLFYVAIFVLDLLLSNIVPFILAIRTSSIKLFYTPSQIGLLNKQQVLQQQYSNKDSSLFESRLIHFNPVDLVMSDKRSRVNGLGVVHQCLLNKKQYSVRSIVLNQVTIYMTDEISQEVERINGIKHQYLSHIHGYYYDDSQLIFLSKHHKQSLFDYINTSPSAQDKLDLMIQLARVLCFLDNLNITHGHLHPHNVLLNKNLRIKLTDLGMMALKKYASVIFGYTNKSSYTAPELLKHRGSVVAGTLAGDIYSFGMIMYYTFYHDVPFSALSIKELQECLARKQRPKICYTSMLVTGA